MNIVLYYIILVVLSFVIYSSYRLSRRDYRKKDVCPKILGVPACYIVCLFFIAALLGHIFFEAVPYWYFGFIAIPFILALLGTITELKGKVICPRTIGGTPMCYLSLGFCSLLIALKILILYL